LQLTPLLVYDKMVRKILFLIFAAFLFLPFLAKAYADSNCSISWQSPNPLTINDKTVGLNIRVNTVAVPGAQVHVNLIAPDGQHYYTSDCMWGNPDNLTIRSTGNIELRNMYKNGYHVGALCHEDTNYLPGTYTLDVYGGWGSGGTKICSTSFSAVSPSSNNKYCTTSVTVNGDTSDALRDPQHDIVFKASNFSASADYDHSCVNVKLFQGVQNTTTGQVDQGDEITESHMNPSDLSSKGFTLPQSTKVAGSTYLVVVKSKCDSPITAPDFDMCSAAIKIHAPLPPSAPGAPPQTNCIADTEFGCSTTADSAKSGNCCNANATCMGDQINNGFVTKGLCILAGAEGGPANSPNAPFCQPGDNNTFVCNTAIGPITTSPDGFIKGILGAILSLAGGIAILLIIISGYRMMVSQGNPENIKNAKDQLTAAIIGLLFVIFSLVILQVIGVNILGLPGFK